MPTEGWLGFDNRTFLTKEEWETYRRRAPVRYARKSLEITNETRCLICGELEAKDNPLQAAHKIPLGVGLFQLGLTPDFLDQPENLSPAHRQKCNKMVEISLEDAIRKLKRSSENIPAYLPAETRQLWDSIS